jgi:tetratricopeptide (TPR) repeat protein
MLRHALAIHLEQSPFLNLYPEARARETLRYMGRPTEAPITTAVAREISQRRGIKALIVGSINPLGGNYVISLEAINGHTGDVLGRELIEVDAKERVLQAVGQAASRLRKTLGESLPSIQKYDVPLEQATTPSLEAFKAYSLGRKLFLSGRFLDAIPHYERATYLDDNFASAYDDLTYCYRFISKTRLAARTAEKALSLSDKVTEYERGSIKVAYYLYATEEIGKAIEVLESMRAVYPRSATVIGTLAGAYHQIGSVQKAEALFKESLALPGDPLAGIELAYMYLARNRIQDARQLLEMHDERDNITVRILRFHIAFMEGDLDVQRQQVEWAKGRPDECFLLASQMRVSAFRGQLRQAREECRRAMDLARRRNLQETSIELSLSMRRIEALMGNCVRAVESLSDVTEGDHWINAVKAGNIFSVCGRAGEATRLVEQAALQAPRATLFHEWWRPNIEAALALARGDARSALRSLELAAPLDPVGSLWVTYQRGQANLLLREGRIAAAEFRRIVENPAQVTPSLVYPLAHIGLARALMLTGNREGACKTYQDLFTLWKDADRDLPVLQQAHAEYTAINP